MTGQQHAAIGIGIALPLGVTLAASAPSGLSLTPPTWSAWGGPALGATVVALVVGGGLLGSLLPDLDSGQSTLESAPLGVLRGLHRRRRWLLWLLLAPLLLPLAGALSLLNWLIMVVSSHRGLTHSLTALALVTAGLWALTTWVVGPTFALGLGAGYASHLAADALTPRGIELAAPWSRRRWYLAPRALRFGGESWRAGCLTALILLGGAALALWRLWRAWG